MARALVVFVSDLWIARNIRYAWYAFSLPSIKHVISVSQVVVLQKSLSFILALFLLNGCVEDKLNLSLF